MEGDGAGTPYTACTDGQTAVDSAMNPELKVTKVRVRGYKCS